MYATTQNWLKDIPTNWTLIGRAHSSEDTLAASARHRLLDRYCGAAWRYLLAVTRNETLAEDLFQDFALRVIRGNFKRAAPENGRFRDYVKTVLINLVNDYYRDHRDGALPLPEQVPARISRNDVDLQDDFITSWRDELLHRTWAALEESHATFYAVLRAHVQDVDAMASEKAQHVSRQLDSPFTANRFRVTLHRAREKFSKLLQQEVAATLDSPSEEELRGELRQLRLLRYCQKAA